MRCHGAYKRWRQSINVEHGADKEVAAYEEMLAAVELTSLFDDACDSVSRTWIFHGLIYILHLFMAELGSLWPFSTAKLEARGGKLKPIWRKQTCKRRPTAVCHRTIAKSRKGLVKGMDPGTRTIVTKWTQTPEFQVLASTRLREKSFCGVPSMLATGMGVCRCVRAKNRLLSSTLVAPRVRSLSGKWKSPCVVVSLRLLPSS